MYTIHLNKLRFFAFHGVYNEEKNTGNEFEVNLSVEVDLIPGEDDFSDAVDYVKLYEVVSGEMKCRKLLIETVAESIISSVFKMYSKVYSAKIEIWKLTPAVEQFQGKIGIEISRRNPSNPN
jgi:dihydroneopterin aldolase